MTEPTNQVYDIITIADLVALVNMNNHEALSRDFGIFLLNVASTKDLLDAAGGDADTLEFNSLQWCDDNINKVTNDVQLTGGDKDKTLRIIITANDETTRD